MGWKLAGTVDPSAKFWVISCEDADCCASEAMLAGSESVAVGCAFAGVAEARPELKTVQARMPDIILLCICWMVLGVLGLGTHWTRRMSSTASIAQ